MLNDDPVIKNRIQILKRNKAIKEEYSQLKKEGMKVSKIWEMLADKYFTSIPNIKKIIYNLSES